MQAFFNDQINAVDKAATRPIQPAPVYTHLIEKEATPVQATLIDPYFF